MNQRSPSRFCAKCEHNKRNSFKREAGHEEQGAWKRAKEFMASRLPYKRIDVNKVTKYLVTIPLRRYFNKADLTHKTVAGEE